MLSPQVSSLADQNSQNVKNIIALGFFDGVHIGHRQILKRTVELSHELGMNPCALTMKNHPKGVLTGKAPLKLISSREREHLMKDIGINDVFFVEFTKEFAAVSPLDFALMLKNEYNAAAVVYGENYTFGAKGAGWGEYGKQIWESIGVVPHCLGHEMAHGLTVSSTLIRSVIAEGDMRTASELLGRPFSITGEVIKGAQKGRQIGFPTINLAAKKGYVLPKNGVYLTRHTYNKQTYFGITNVGVRPTFYDDSHVFVECHILDFSGDMYGREVKIEFLDKIRDEHKFPTIDALREQIAKDKESAYNLIKGVK